MQKHRATETQGGLQAAFPPRFASERDVPPALPHFVEQQVQQALLSEPNFHFSSLVVRRINNGVCLQGVLESDDDAPDVCSVAQRVAGVQNVLNRLVITARK